MWQYHFSLAFRSLKERKRLTFLMVLILSLGLGLFITFYTVSKNSLRTPHANKASDLHLVLLDHREKGARPINQWARMPSTTYKDAMNLMQADMPAVHQALIFRSFGTLSVDDGSIRPMNTRSAAVTPNFFSMFEPPMLYGNPWSHQEGERGSAVIIINKTTNERLFGGVNSVGKTLYLESQPMTVVGVLDDWFLSARVYDRRFFGGYPHDYFVPFQYALNQNLFRDTRMSCHSHEQERSGQYRHENLDELLNSECGWLNLWAEFPERHREEYTNRVNRYVEQQQQLGRLPQEKVLVHLPNVVDFMTFRKEWNRGRDNVLNTQLFFVVCLLNAIGILLAKFARRTKEISIRRALGARKSAIIASHTIEVLLIGLISGVIGIFIALGGLKIMLQVGLYAEDYTARIEDLIPFYQMDVELVIYALSISLFSCLLISIFPIWRLCRQSMATHLRTQ